MGVVSTLFSDDIILDEEAFKKASTDLDALSERLNKLNGEIEDMLKLLEKGFNTPAGRKFIKACQNNLRQPMKDQKAVLEHISQTLKDVSSKYDAVFTEYTNLNSAINAYNHDV